ncbi:MAG: hypothetical protein FWH52_03235 [Synergistaceae bacterium]|nr:hypothetical protein [Synergistaceae bacterium]
MLASSYSFVSKINSGSIASSMMEEATKLARDKVISVLAASAEVASWQVTLATFAIEQVKAYIKRMDQIKASEAFLNEMTFYAGIDLLGGRICYTEVGNQLIISSIDLENSEVMLKTIGYCRLTDIHTIHNLSTGETRKEYVLKPEELVELILKGDPERSDKWTPLENCRLSKEQQRVVYKEFSNYTEETNKYSDDVLVLNVYKNDYIDMIKSKFGDKYSQLDFANTSVEILPPEVLVFVLDLKGGYFSPLKRMAQNE